MPLRVGSHGGFVEPFCAALWSARSFARAHGSSGSAGCGAELFRRWRREEEELRTAWSRASIPQGGSRACRTPGRSAGCPAPILKGIGLRRVLRLSHFRRFFSQAAAGRTHNHGGGFQPLCPRIPHPARRLKTAATPIPPRNIARAAAYSADRSNPRSTFGSMI